MNVVVIANPFAGTDRGRLDGARAVDLLRARGVAATLRATAGPGDATRLAAEAAAAGVGAVVAVGGDGTVHETACGLVGTGTPLGVLPSGSGNDFAQGIGCPDVAAGLAAVTAGRERALDVAHVDGEPFVNSLGLFASGRISGRAARLWRRLGRWRYTVATVATVLDTRGVDVQWRCDDGEPRRERCLLAEICNGPTTGGGFRLAPDAVPDDGWLDACLVAPLPPWAGLRLVAPAARGERLDHPAVRYVRARELRFACAAPVPCHRDGEPGILAAGAHVVGLLEQKLLVLVPGAGAGSDTEAT